MTTRRPRALAGIRLETLEGRLALSGAAVPLHALAASHGAQAHVAQAHVAQAHATSHKAPAVPNPVLVNLTPNTSGVVITDATYDPRVHLLTIKGTVDVSAPPTSPYPGYPYPGYPGPTYPTSTYITVAASQAVNRTASVSGSQYSSVAIADASVKTVQFTDKLVATSGEFESGNVVVTVGNSGPYYYYGYNMHSFIVHPRKMNAY